MEPSYILNIFPAGSLSISVVTTVWLGVWVVVFFNLRLGWVLSGLVVPGYLVPLLLVKPWSAALVVAEGALTYFIVWMYSEKLSRVTGFTNFFGRDRFFALLLTSVLIRVCCDVYLLPVIGEYINTSFNVHFDYRNNLQSFGLIVIALIANQFWKPGFRRGIVVLAVTVFLTFLLVRYVLMPFTNFSVGNLAYMYEDLAASMLAGPKAYIVILTTAFIASHLNLRYGWEYSGILIPALLALEWYQPGKLFVTFLETFFILIVSSQLLKLPLFQRTTMEGARKLLFFFNISFIYKLALGHIILNFFPSYHISDFYGFGYLLSTLLAVKMHDKEIAALITRASLQTSLLALFAATVLGFSLGFVPNIFSVAGDDTPPSIIAQKSGKKSSLLEIVKEEQILLYKTVRPNSVPIPLSEELDIFKEALRLLKQSILTGNSAEQQHSFRLFERLHYSAHEIDNRYLVLRELEPKRGWGMYIVNLQAGKELQIQVPDPLGEWGTNTAGLSLFKMLNCRSLAIAGSRRSANDNGSADVLATNSSFFYIFQQVFGKNDVLQLRAVTERNYPRLLARKVIDDNTSAKEVPSILMINKSIPEGLNLSLLQENIGFFQVFWRPAPYSNSLRESSTGGFAELFLTRDDRRALLFTPFANSDQHGFDSEIESISGNLYDWLYEKKNHLAPKGSELYSPPTLEELLFWDKEILTPLVRFVGTTATVNQLSDQDMDDLRVVKNAAGTLGYNLMHYRQEIANGEYLILTEDGHHSPNKYWGTYIFRLGTAKGFSVQVPRPLSERNVFEYAVSLFDNLQATTLFISGSHPLANRNGSADVIRVENKVNMFNLANQVLLRETGPKEMMVILCRAFAPVPGIDVPDALIATHSGLTLDTGESSLIRELEKILVKQYHFSVQYFSGLASEAGYEVSNMPQVLYLDQTENKELVNLWLSPSIRSVYRQQTENRTLLSHFSLLQIPTKETDLYNYLTQDHTPAATAPEDIPLAMIQDLIADYIRSNDILILQKVVISWPAITFENVLDTRSRQSFLVVMTAENQPLMAANLLPLRDDFSMKLSTSLTRTEFRNFIDSRCMWLSITGEP